ncbi:MAG: aminofutalosine synthase MqnE [Euryarchaeota archaeon]|jgi:aminodeoxyfutalosine synthase|nr:aminofutalosine synthase MqnE [Euryarchaeota archaeon]|tara:strand:+ start:3776 stop:4951 length:1176 start_codon:yes stop_codon:yes gene_type:complete
MHNDSGAMPLEPNMGDLEGNEAMARARIIISEGGRIDFDLGLSLYKHAPLLQLGELAHSVKRKMHGEKIHFNLNLHVNTTNICVLACRFCAFRKGSKHEDAYYLSVEEYLDRVRPYSESIDEVHSVGGLHPEWTIDHYENLYRAMKKEFPHITIKSLTAVEIKHIAKRTGITIPQTLTRLMDAGLDAIPGGGAEILVDSVRDRICRGKESSLEYLSIHRSAHEAGLPTNCTMLFGTVETLRDRITHLDLLRRLQDETSGFQCFVPYPFLPDKTRLPEAKIPSAEEVLRTISISRLMLDNIPHLKAYRMNIGDDLASLAILNGADDLDGTVEKEEIMHSAGSSTPLNTGLEGLVRMIESTGQEAVQRNTTYTKFRSHTLKNHSGPRALPVVR